MIIKKKALLKSIKLSKCHSEHDHPDHIKEASKLKKLKKQIEEILGMIDKKLYCPDILSQVKAAKATLLSVEQSILKTHVDNCVSEAIKNKDENVAKKKIEELIKLVDR